MKTKTNFKRTSISMLLIVALLVTMAVPAFASEPLQLDDFDRGNVSGIPDEFENVDKMVDGLDISSLGFDFDRIPMEYDCTVAELLEEQHYLWAVEAALIQTKAALSATDYDRAISVSDLVQMVGAELQLEQTQSRLTAIENALEEKPNFVFLTHEDLVRIGAITPMQAPITPPNTTNIQYTGQLTSTSAGGRQVWVFRVTASPRGTNFALNPSLFRIRDTNLLAQQSHTMDTFNRTLEKLTSSVIASRTPVSIFTAATINRIFGGASPNIRLDLDIEGGIIHLFIFASFNSQSGFMHMQTSNRISLNELYLIRRNQNGVIILEVDRLFSNQLISSANFHATCFAIAQRLVNGQLALVRDSLGSIRWRVHLPNGSITTRLTFNVPFTATLCSMHA